MTNKAILQASAAFEGLPEATIDKALAARFLDGAEVYTPLDAAALDLVQADLYMELLATPDYSAGSVSIAYDRAVLERLALQLYRQHEDAKGLARFGSVEGINAVELW